jgi:hypothetical protein
MAAPGSAVRSLEIELHVIVTYWRLGLAWRYAAPQLRRCGNCPSCTALAIHLLAESRGGPRAQVK